MHMLIIARQYQEMGSTQCQQCQPERNELDFTAYSNFKSINEIEQKYKSYADCNLVGFYSVRVQKNVEKLYTLGQIAICDAIIRLSCQKKHEARDKLLDDAESIDLEELDHLSLIEALPKNVQSTYNATSSNFYEIEDESQLGRTSLNLLKKRQLKTNNQYGLRMLNKHALKDRITKKGHDQMEGNRFFVIATVGCFQTREVLSPSSLPTQKTPLRLFLQKIEGSNLNYKANILVIFIVNPESQSQFDSEVEAYEKAVREDYSDLDEFDIPSIKYEKILYKPLFPCVDHSRKIQMSPSDEIMFNYKGGDLIGFIMKHPRLEGLLEKYQFIQFANIGNLLEIIGDRQILAYLEENIEIDIVAPVILNENISCLETLKLNKYFVERVGLNGKQHCQKQYQLTQTFYIRSLLLSHKTSHFQKLISTRIKSQPLPGKPDIVTFTRSLQHILYSPITLLLITMSNFSRGSRQEINYSNYCKKVLGIKQTKDEQAVQICPQMLFAGKSPIQQIIKKLSQLQTVGFPLVLNRQRLNLKKSSIDEK